MSLLVDMPVTADTLVVGISLPARWAPGINRAAELLRERHPKADDDEIMRIMLLHGVVDVIDSRNNDRRRGDDDMVTALVEEAL